MGATKPSQAYQSAMEAVVPEADGIFITCTNFRCSDVIEEIENDSGIPVVTSNQATAWHLMKLLGINDVVEGYGQLLRKTPRV
jgi:maleate isomerase